MNHDFNELRLDGVTRRFAGAGGHAFAALNELTLTIKRGEFIALLGPSGCGKSTALNCIAGLMQLSGGSIWLDETRIDTLPPEKRGFGMVFQNYALFPHMTVAKNIGFGLRMRGLSDAEIAPRVAHAMKLVQLIGQEHKLPGQLSGGQQQRVAIARAIVIEPPLVLMDEPLSNLDAKLRIETRAEIRRIHKELGRSTIYVTHDQDEALSLADRIVVMKDGVVQQIAAPHDVYGQPSNLHVARFMGYRNVLELERAKRSRAIASPVRAGHASDRRAQAALGGWTRLRRHAPGGASCLASLPDGANTIAGRIDNVEYCGRDSLVDVVTASGTLLHVRCDGHAATGRHRSRAGPGRARAGISAERHPLSTRPRRAAERRPFDRALLLVVPAAAFMLLLFVYPFLYGLALSFNPKEGGALANYSHFFTTDNLWPTIWTTLAAGVSRHADQRRAGAADRVQDAREVAVSALATTILVIPITLGTVLIAQGMLTYFGPKGWLSQFLQFFHLYEGAIRLTHNYWGVLISLVISGFPFAFLLILSYITGIDPVLARAASTLGANPRAQFRTIYLPLLAPGLAMCFCLAFVQAFSVFPSAVLLGSPAGPTRVISIAAYEAAFEQYDYSLASAIAMIMGFVQLVIVAAVLGLRNLMYRGPVSGGKG